MNKSMLLVEQEREILQLEAQLLKASGYAVTEASSGTVALALEGKFDLAIVDLTMEDMDGITAMRLLKAKHPGLRVIITSGYPEKEEEVQSQGADAFLPKPFSSEEILAATEALLAA